MDYGTGIFEATKIGLTGSTYIIILQYCFVDNSKNTIRSVEAKVAGSHMGKKSFVHVTVLFYVASMGPHGIDLIESVSPGCKEMLLEKMKEIEAFNASRVSAKARDHGE
nr:hypothetical protein [Tanacetum cinerariifolium]